jgi:hypothetical protein
MPEIGLSGTARGADRKVRPYRDTPQPDAEGSVIPLPRNPASETPKSQPSIGPGSPHPPGRGSAALPQDERRGIGDRKKAAKGNGSESESGRSRQGETVRV